MAEDAASGEEPKKKNPILLFVIIGLLLVGLSVGGTLFFVMKANAPEEPVVEEPVKPEALYYALNPAFQTNYDVKGRQRLFQLAIAFMTREQDVVDALATHAPSIKSRLVILLSGQEFTALQTPSGRETLRQKCLDAVQEILKKEIGKPGVEKVLFTDFVMQ